MDRDIIVTDLSVSLTEIDKKLPRYTDREIVILNGNSSVSQLQKEVANLSLRLASNRDFYKKPNLLQRAFEQADGLIFDNLGLAIVNQARNHSSFKLTIHPRAQQFFLTSGPDRYPLPILSVPVRIVQQIYASPV